MYICSSKEDVFIIDLIMYNNCIFLKQLSYKSYQIEHGLDYLVIIK